MSATRQRRRTTVGNISAEVLSFTAGRDRELDPALAEVDCIGSAAHAVMLSRMPLRHPIFTAREVKRVILELSRIMGDARRGRFTISLADQDVHLAIERRLTEKLGDLGKKVHTGRSRNDQVALDLRLYAKIQLLDAMDEVLRLVETLLALARNHVLVPMVGRTHIQPAMPSTVGLWASAHAESLLDDVVQLIDVYELNDQCPLGSAASYGVPLPLDRELTARLLGFSRPVHNVLYANNARGKLEAAILGAMTQVMLSLSRIAQDLMLFTMPEFNYFSFPPEYGTGSSIMPQKNNPDVLELVRARAASVIANGLAVTENTRALPSGYNRDLQETKGPFFDGVATTRSCVRVMHLLMGGVRVNEQALRAGFSPGVFATDRALELVAGGMPFRDAYRHIKEHLDELDNSDAGRAVALKKHWGATAGLDFKLYAQRLAAARDFAMDERKAYYAAVTKLMGAVYPPAG